MRKKIKEKWRKTHKFVLRRIISLQRRRVWLTCVYVDDDMTARRRKTAFFPLHLQRGQRTEDAVSCGLVELASRVRTCVVTMMIFRTCTVSFQGMCFRAWYLSHGFMK